MRIKCLDKADSGHADGSPPTARYGPDDRPESRAAGTEHPPTPDGTSRRRAGQARAGGITAREVTRRTQARLAALTTVAIRSGGMHRSSVGASTITRTSCSVPDGRSSTRPSSPSSASAAGHRGLDVGCRGRRQAVRHRHVDRSTWGSLVITAASSASDLPVAAIRAIRCRPVRMPSPVVAYARHDDVPALLPAEREPGRCAAPPAP